MRFLVLPLVILILVIGFLIYKKMSDRQAVRREELRKGQEAQRHIELIREEVLLQLGVGRTTDLFTVQSLVRDYDEAIKPRKRRREIRS